jgi:hypothetical protein
MDFLGHRLPIRMVLRHIMLTRGRLIEYEVEGASKLPEVANTKFDTQPFLGSE